MSMIKRIPIRSVLRVAQLFGDTAEVAVQALRAEGHEVTVTPEGFVSGAYHFMNDAQGVVLYLRKEAT